MSNHPRSKDNCRRPEDSPAAWSAALERAGHINNFALAAQATRELERLGVTVKYLARFRARRPAAGRWAVMQEISGTRTTQIHVEVENLIIANGPQSTAAGKIVQSKRTPREGNGWLPKVAIRAIVKFIEVILQLLIVWYTQGG